MWEGCPTGHTALRHTPGCVQERRCPLHRLKQHYVSAGCYINKSAPCVLCGTVVGCFERVRVCLSSFHNTRTLDNMVSQESDCGVLHGTHCATDASAVVGRREHTLGQNIQFRVPCAPCEVLMLP